MTPEDVRHLRRCVELAAEAAQRGDDPFGSLLTSAQGEVLAERRNRVVTSGDCTGHPELDLASWASVNLTPRQRAEATIYTSGEHCPMCAIAQIWAGVGRLVFVLSAEQIRAVSSSQTIIDLNVREIVARSNAELIVEGPCDELVPQASALFQ
ncbi:MAG: nucleoside deaminase [Acidimicrobiia bacterium]|nr:nucleoside deaminase [Acidimicrobiia bacterium]